MATNKVVYGDRTLIDLTSDSVTPSSLLEGETAHDRSGAQITGTLGDFTGATSSTAGAHGLVPAPAAGDEDKVLKGNGTWGEASSSGHTILNSQGQQVPARANLQFGKSVVTDDETNDVTKVNVNNAIEKTYAEFQNMTPAERGDGSVYYIPDYPTLGNVFFFRTVDAMQAAIQHGDVPNNAICITTADYPYEAKAEDVTYDNTDSDLDATNVQDAVDEVKRKSKWLYLGSSSIGSPLSFNLDDYDELCIIGSPISSQDPNAYVCSITIPTIDVLTRGSSNFIMGFGGTLNTSTPNGARIYIGITRTTIVLHNAQYDGVNQTTATIYVYGKLN